MAQRTSAICQVPWGPGPWCSEWWPSRWARRLRGALVANSWEPRHVKVKTHYFRGSRNWFKGLFFPEPPNVGVEPMVSCSFSLKSIPYFCARKGLFYRLKGIMTIDWRYWCWLFSNYEDTIYVWGIAASDILKGGMDSAQVYVRRTSNNVGKALVNHSYN